MALSYRRTVGHEPENANFSLNRDDFKPVGIEILAGMEGYLSINGVSWLICQKTPKDTALLLGLRLVKR